MMVEFALIEMQKQPKIAHANDTLSNGIGMTCQLSYLVYKLVAGNQSYSRMFLLLR